MDIDAAFRSTDPLGEALHFLRMRGVFYCDAELSTPWGVSMPPMDDVLMFHFVARGACSLVVADVEQGMREGDLALVPHGGGHVLRSDSAAEIEALFDVPRELVGQGFERIRHGGGGVSTKLICGAVRFDDPAAGRLLRMLPASMHVDVSSPNAAWMREMLRLMAEEAGGRQPGGEAIVTRLADILVIQVIRNWIASDPAAQKGWLAGLKDRQIGRAIRRIHGDPAHAWTLESLAEVAAMSRTAFAARFSTLVGVPPMRYLAQWRLQMAARYLKENHDPLARIATRVGYESEAAFSRAFKREFGASPGELRR
jgi:AraC-like DNA-binding protein